MESIPVKMVWTLEMTTKDSVDKRNLIDKAVTGFERTDSNFEKKFYCG